MTRFAFVVLSLSFFAISALTLATSDTSFAQDSVSSQAQTPAKPADPFAVPPLAEPAAEPVAEPVAEPAAEPAAEPKKPRVYRGRLPNYYPSVVTEAQRKEIYTIQLEYYDKIKALRAQIEAMAQERDTRVQAVLSADQLKEVQRIAAEAKVNREKSTQ